MIPYRIECTKKFLYLSTRDTPRLESRLFIQIGKVEKTREGASREDRYTSASMRITKLFPFDTVNRSRSRLTSSWNRNALCFVSIITKYRRLNCQTFVEIFSNYSAAAIDFWDSHFSNISTMTIGPPQKHLFLHLKLEYKLISKVT